MCIGVTMQRFCGKCPCQYPTSARVLVLLVLVLVLVPWVLPCVCRACVGATPLPFAMRLPTRLLHAYVDA